MPSADSKEIVKFHLWNTTLCIYCIRVVDMISSISISDLLNIKDTVHVIDVRSPQSYNNNHMDGAINIPYEKLIANPSEYLNPNIRYYIYCQKGLTSGNVCQILNRMGYKATNIIGGYEEWILLS